ncbi:MAG: polyphosphate:AMP phosphotransferase, partial [Gammaproteobacteria bacterium]|nr:polyphosphate:AMP phosphotransferase [Gammaproteobacteria bacterium]
VKLDTKLDNGIYKKRLKELQAELHELTWQAKQEQVSAVAVFEGWDAAGKGGCIRRMAQAIDARMARVISVGAPTDEERARHYLWRFWRQIPRAGKVTIYDRSWYGRVLVERVEGFAAEPEWRRAYFEINDFEEQLAEAGIVVMKYWLHIDRDEQYRRFKEREQTPYKRHKLTEEDWRNREKWHAYEQAVNEMVARTSTEIAPWNLIPANDKYYARIQVVEKLCAAMRNRLG